MLLRRLTPFPVQLHLQRRFMHARHVGQVLQQLHGADILAQSSTIYHEPCALKQRYIVGQETPVHNVATIMVTHGLGSLLVRDPFRHAIIGRVSDRHISRALASEMLEEETPVEQIMGGGVTAVTLECRVERALALMLRHHVRHLSVFDAGLVPANLKRPLLAGVATRGLPEDSLSGVVSIVDLVRAYTQKPVPCEPHHRVCS